MVKAKAWEVIRTDRGSNRMFPTQKEAEDEAHRVANETGCRVFIRALDDRHSYDVGTVDPA